MISSGPEYKTDKRETKQQDEIIKHQSVNHSQLHNNKYETSSAIHI